MTILRLKPFGDLFQCIIFIAMFCCSISLPATAETQLSFYDSIKKSFSYNNELKNYEYGVLAKHQGINTERSGYLPKLGFEEAFGSTNNPTNALSFRLNQAKVVASSLELQNLNHPNPINNFLTGIYFDQSLFDKKTIAKVAIAKNESSSQRYDYLRKKEEIISNVIKAYLNVEKDKALVKIAQKNLEESKENKSLAELRFKNKTAYYSAVLRTTTALKDAEADLLRHQSTLKITKRALGLAIGIDDSVNTVDNDIPALKVKDIEYYNNVSSSRNDIHSLRILYEKSKNNIKLAESNYYPKMGVNGGYQFYDPYSPFSSTGQNYTVNAYLRWDIFDGTKAHFEKSSARYQSAQAHEDLEGFKKKVSFEVYKAYIKLEDAKNRVEISKSALKSSEDAKSQILHKYKSTDLPVIDLLNVQSVINDQRDIVEMNKNDYQNALFDLCFQSGTIIDELGLAYANR